MCAEEDLGDHIPLAWNNSPVKLHRNHMLRSQLVIWLQPCGSPRRESRKIDLQKGNVAWMQGENPTDLPDIQEPCGFLGSCEHPGKPGIGSLTEIQNFPH